MKKEMMSGIHVRKKIGVQDSLGEQKILDQRTHTSPYRSYLNLKKLMRVVGGWMCKVLRKLGKSLSEEKWRTTKALDVVQAVIKWQQYPTKNSLSTCPPANEQTGFQSKLLDKTGIKIKQLG